MAAWDVFFPRVLVRVPNVPSPLMRQALRDAAREFCEKSLAWRQWIACAAPTNPETRWSFTLPADSEMQRLERVTVNGTPVEVRGILTLTRDPLVHGANEERAAVTQDLVLFHLLGQAVTGTVQAFATLIPTTEAATAPDFITRRYLVPIAAGAAAKLLELPDTPWSTLPTAPAAAMRARDDFEKGIASAQTDTFRGHTAETPRARINWC